MDRPDSREAIDEVLKSLTKEERQTLQNCQRTGFIIGSMWGLTLLTMRHIAVQNNKMKKPTLGSNVGVFLINLVLGYMAYTPFCATRAIEPKMRKILGANKQESSFQAEPTLPMEDPNFQGSLLNDLDGPAPSFSNFSPSFDSNLEDNLILEDEEKHKPKFQTTYEDLRRQNRESYKAKSFGSEGLNQPLQPIREPTPKAEIPKRVKTNKYGDPLE